MIELYRQCSVEGNNIYLPKTQLDRKEYLAIKTTFEKNGGKWVGGRVQAFVFSTPPNSILQRLQEGEVVNTKKEFQEFFTPRELCKQVIKLAEIREGDAILEPSAGSGNMIKEIIRQLPETKQIDYCEIQERNVRLIKELPQGFTQKHFLTFDFLKLDVDKENLYDVIVANPPFNKNQDIIHLRKMYDHLKVGGRLVCITSIGWLTNATKPCATFREWLKISENYEYDNLRIFENIGKSGDYKTPEFEVHLEMNDDKAFKESKANVRTMIIKIVKLIESGS